MAARLARCVLYGYKSRGHHRSAAGERGGVARAWRDACGAVRLARSRGCGADSDTDIMIEIDPDARIGVWDYVGIKDFIAGLFDGPVDVVKHKNLKPSVRPAVTADAIYAF